MAEHYKSRLLVTVYNVKNVGQNHVKCYIVSQLSIYSGMKLVS